MKTALRLTLALLFCVVLCLCLVPGALGDGFYPLPGIIRGDFTLPANTTIIEDEAFSDCGWMKTVTIPAGVTRIGNNAFSGCINLDDVYYGGTQEQWGQITKGTGNEALTQATLHCTDSHPVVDSGIWGVLTWKLDDQGTLTISGNGEMDGFTYDSEEAWRKYKTDICSVVIDKDVTSIGDNAFRYCKGLTSVTIPGSMTSIGSGAFEGCRDLTSVTIPDSVTTIGNYAFKLSGLRSVTIGNSVTNIGDEAFEECDRLWSLTIPDSVNIIGKYAFRLCQGLKSVTIGKSVTTIGGGAFDACSDLRSMTIPKSVTTIGDAAFRFCGLTDIHVEEGNTAYCDINGVLFNKTVDSILLYPNRSGEYTIPDSVTTIGNYAFYVCDDLTSVTIPDSVTTIGDYAFFACDELTSVTIPDSVTSIGFSAFDGCSGLTSVTIPDSVTSIGSSAFRSCGLTSVTVPGSVTRIKGETFYACSGLTSATIEDGVNSIGVNAFAYCSAMTSVSIPGSMESIDDSAFYNCDKLTDVYYTGSEKQWNALIPNLGFSNTPLLEAQKHYYSEGVEDYDFIESGVLCSGEGWSVNWEVLYNRPFVNTIDDVLLNIYFEGSCESNSVIMLFEDINMMPWLTRFQKTDFERICIQGSIDCPLGIYGGQFSGYSNVRTVQLTSVESVGDGAFIGCASLETVKFDEVLRYIGNGTFKNDTSLSSFKNNSLSCNIELIGDEAFMNTGLRHFSFYSTIMTIGKRAFQDTQLVYAVIINVGSIGENAFDSDITIYCYRDSEAHLYAKKERIAYVLLDEVHDDPEPYFETTFTSSSPNIGNATVRLKRGFDFIDTDSSIFNYELALTAITLSAQVYKPAQGMKTDGILSELGCDIVDYFNNVSTHRHPGACFGYKQIEQGKNLFTVVVRGTDTTNDMTDIMTDIYDGAETMFRDSSINIKKQLKVFMEAVTGKTIAELKQEDNYFFLTGHSLGGAVVNHLSADSDILELADYNKGKIYTYTFESPHTCVNLWGTDPESESNAFNYKVDGDAATNVPPYIGSTTYGKDVWIKVSELDDGLFNALFPNSSCKTLADATSVGGHGDKYGLHDVFLDLIYVIQHSEHYSGGGGGGSGR